MCCHVETALAVNKLGGIGIQIMFGRQKIEYLIFENLIEGNQLSKKIWWIDNY